MANGSMPVGATTRVVSNDPWDHVAAIAAAQTRIRAESKVVRFAIMIVSRSLLPMIKVCHRPGRATVTGITVFRFAQASGGSHHTDDEIPRRSKVAAGGAAAWREIIAPLSRVDVAGVRGSRRPPRPEYAVTIFPPEERPSIAWVPPMPAG